MRTLIIDLQNCSCLQLKEKKSVKISNNRHPSLWISFPPMLRNQTLSQYLSPDSIYSAQHTTYLNSHLVSQSLLSSAMQCIHFSLQMVPVLHSAVHTYSFQGFMNRHLLWPNFLELVIHVSLFLNACFAVMFVKRQSLISMVVDNR